VTSRPPTPEEAGRLADVLLGARLLRPYYARAIGALRPVMVEGLATVAVDRWWRLYIGPKWLESTTTADAALVVGAHEVEHLLRAHSRLEDIPAPPATRNLAADAEINDDDDALAAYTDRVGGVTPDRIGCPDGLLAEQYLSHLLDSPTRHGPLCSGGSGVGAPIEGELAPSDGTSVSEQDASTIRSQVAADVMDAAARAPGTVPGRVVMWAEAEAARHRRPPPSWRALLRSALGRALASTGRREACRTRIHRRYRYGDPVRAGARPYAPRVGLVVDTSGSMSGDGDVALSAIGRVCGMAAPGGLLIAHGDTEVTITRRLPREWTGGGGTDLRVHTAALMRRGVDALVIVTDMETPWPPAPAVPVVIVDVTTGRCHGWGVTGEQ